MYTWETKFKLGDTVRIPDGRIGEVNIIFIDGLHLDKGQIERMRMNPDIDTSVEMNNYSENELGYYNVVYDVSVKNSDEFVTHFQKDLVAVSP